MDYTSYRPAFPLNTYIDDIYYLNGASPYRRFRVFPMPSLHLMINLGDRFQVYKPEQTQAILTCKESWSLGLWNTYHIAEWPQSVRLYGIHFKPNGAYPFLQHPLSEMSNQITSLEDIWGGHAAEIRERLYAAPSVQQGFALLEQWLLSHLREAPHGLNVVQYAVNEIARQHGTLSIRELSEQIGISPSHLVTHFNRIVGIPPKALARFYRFARVLSAIDLSKPVDWARMAHESNFYDQSHFNKNFLSFTGYNPTDYMHIRQQLNLADPIQAQNLGQMPIG